MGDIRLVQQSVFPYQTEVSADWMLLSDGTLDDTQALATAVIVALGTDHLADENDILPDPDSTDRKGWWGDLDADVIWGAWPIGCRLWLMRRSKIAPSESAEGSTLVRIKYYIQEALQPFIDLRIVSGMEVAVTRRDKQRIDAIIRLFRGPKIVIELQYEVLWDDQALIPQSDFLAPAPPVPIGHGFTLDKSTLGGEDVLG
jgi:phage gp46-like protein